MNINFQYPVVASVQNHFSMTNCVIPVEEPMKPLMMHEMEICFLAALREHFDLTQVTTKFLNGDLERSGKTVGVTSASFCRRCCFDMLPL